MIKSSYLVDHQLRKHGATNAPWHRLRNGIFEQVGSSSVGDDDDRSRKMNGKVLDRFSISGRQAVLFARASVDGNVIELRHLASGLARGGNELTKELLAGKGLELPEAQGLERDVPFSPEVERAVRNAIEEADSFGHSTVTSDHVLLGALREGLTIEGLTLTDARKAIRERSRQESAGPPGFPADPRRQ